MRPALIILTLVLFGFTGCRKQKFEKQLEGNYTGVFYRTAPSIDYTLAHVTLRLNQDSYTGTSDIVKYPAICNGSWETDNDVIRFTNQCPWTAEFDWTFILNGEYKYELNGSHLKIIRSYSNGTSDIYELEKN